MPQTEHPADPPSGEAADRRIRGSALLMAGRGISIALNFAVQILTVRILAKTDYGAFAYALAMASLGTRISLFGLNKTASRWAAIYHERREREKLIGAVLLMTGTIVALGTGLVLAVFGLQGLIGRQLVSGPLSLALLLILILLAPINALDNLFTAMFAVFAHPRLIFFRRHIVGPGLKLGAVLLVLGLEGDARMLALAYVGGGLLGLAIGVSLFVRLVRDHDLLSGLGRIRVPVREILGFSLPMFHSDFALALRGTLVIFLLELFHGSLNVADYRSVMPVARLNVVVLESFGLLFMPAVARLIARKDSAAVERAHENSACWITLLSFPVFAMTFAAAGPLTLLLFGERYADSAWILSVLSLGYFMHASLGLNSHTLKVCGNVRHILAADFGAITIGLTANLLLIPGLGARGAGIGVCVTLICHVLLNQIGLRRSVGLPFVQRRHLLVFGLTATAGLTLRQIHARWEPPLAVMAILVGVVWLALLMCMREQLEIGKTFPEVRRIPGLGRLFVAGVPAGGRAVK